MHADPVKFGLGARPGGALVARVKLVRARVRARVGVSDRARGEHRLSLRQIGAGSNGALGHLPVTAQRVSDRLGRLRLGPLAQASDGEEDDGWRWLQREQLARYRLRRRQAQMQGERAELDDDEVHVPRQMREQARQHVLRGGRVLRGIDKCRPAARPRCLEELDQANGEPLVWLRLLRPLQLHRHGAVEEHAPLARLVDAPAILCN